MSSSPAATGPRIATAAEPERVRLDEDSWVDVYRGWLEGPDEVLATVLARGSFAPSTLFRYDHYVEEPRLAMWCRAPHVPDPILIDAQRTITHRYRSPFDGFNLALYRDGQDSVAFHRDRDMRWCEDTIIAILTLGARRPFLIRPRANRYDHETENRGATHDLAPAAGDLLVMGGRCQVAWEHSVPKVRRPLGPRVSAQWRWTARRGRPEQGASYRAPRHYGR